PAAERFLRRGVHRLVDGKGDGLGGVERVVAERLADGLGAGGVTGVAPRAGGGGERGDPVVEGAHASASAFDTAASFRMRAAALSAIIMTGALVLPLTISGMTEASTTRSRSTPRTRRSRSTTAPSSGPIRQVPTGW